MQLVHKKKIKTPTASPKTVRKNKNLEPYVFYENRLEIKCCYIARYYKKIVHAPVGIKCLVPQS